MRPCVSVGWGSSLNTINGAGGRTLNTAFQSDSASAVHNNTYNADYVPLAGSNYHSSLFGGTSSLMPDGYCNHLELFILVDFILHNMI
ncbi:MAG: hypothetical protein ACXAC6_19605 [Candidatus Hodarchaeales archaeon]|jgi:hypothetical protein